MTSKTARCLFIASALAAATAAAQNSTVATAGATASPGGAPYKVVDGFYVDDATLQGFKTWRAAACDRCHGANQQGLVGPSLIDSLKTMSKADFVKTLTDGRLEKGMPSWSNSPNVMQNMDALYAYLKGRSDGAITQAHVQPLAQAPSASGTKQQ